MVYIFVEQLHENDKQKSYCAAERAWEVHRIYCGTHDYERMQIVVTVQIQNNTRSTNSLPLLKCRKILRGTRNRSCTCTWLLAVKECCKSHTRKKQNTVYFARFLTHADRTKRKHESRRTRVNLIRWLIRTFLATLFCWLAPCLRFECS